MISYLKRTEYDLASEYGDRFGNYPCTLVSYSFDAMGGRPKPVTDAILLLPGGAYYLVADRESDPVATAFLCRGFTVFILDYATADRYDAKFPIQLLQAAAAVSWIRKNAEELCVRPDTLSVCGFSAGGHLAASLACMHNSKEVLNAGFSESAKPYRTILCYPVISSGEFAHAFSIHNLTGDDPALNERVSLEKQVTPDTVPTMIWHTAEDSLVDCRNSLLFAWALSENKVPYEMHIFPKGDHGLVLANESTAMGDPAMADFGAEQWVDLAVKFIHRPL